MNDSIPYKTLEHHENCCMVYCWSEMLFQQNWFEELGHSDIFFGKKRYLYRGTGLKKILYTGTGCSADRVFYYNIKPAAFFGENLLKTAFPRGCIGRGI